MTYRNAASGIRVQQQKGTSAFTDQPVRPGGKPPPTDRDVNTPTGDPHQLRHLGTIRVRQNRFEDEALTLRDELMADRGSQFGRFVGTEVEFPGQFVGIDEAKAARGKVGVIKCGFARAIRPGDGHHDGSRVKKRYPVHGCTAQSAATKTRLTKRPRVRVPSSSIFTSRPASPAHGSK